MIARLTFVHALSPLHAGTGQGVGVIDLPIAREKATGLPFLPGSSLKGSLRALRTDEECKLVFGPASADIPTNENAASAAQFSDQRLLLLPVRSLVGTFAWITSPYLLRRFARDIADIAQSKQANITIPDVEKTTHCLIAEGNSKIKIGTNPEMVYLEDLDLQAQTQNQSAATAWATWIGQRVFPNNTTWQTMLIERFCIVHDDVLNFLLDTATEITARIKLREDSKTVQDGGLWYEEALPTETILSGIVLATPIKSSITAERVLIIISELTEKPVQFGGKATVGRGLCRVRLSQEGA